MRKKCPNCALVNFAAADKCRRCAFDLIEVTSFERSPAAARRASGVRRAADFSLAVIVALTLLYLSLVSSAKRLEYEEEKMVERAITVLAEKGFSREAFVLRYLTTYRGNDNWLNASTRDETAYAAANFPFEILTLYPDFFRHSVDDTERAAILLHEAQHLLGGDEKQAYEYVWKSRQKLGWTKETYEGSIVWRNTRNLTREQVPELFICGVNEYGDCTEQQQKQLVTVFKAESGK